MTNLFRNWGDGVGIAFITTAVERRNQFHQTTLGSAISTTSQLNSRLTDVTNYLTSHGGYSGPDAAAAANKYFYGQLQHQVSLLSFMDCFRVIAWVTFAAIALLSLLQRFAPAKKVEATH